jgi:uncharacterized protein
LRISFQAIGISTFYNCGVAPVVIVFAKAPRAGSVKTRLIGVLGAEGAAALHEEFVREMLGRLAGRFEVELHTDVATGAWPEFEGTRTLQAEGDLGARMYEALRLGLGAGRPRVCLVGGDAPTLPPEYVQGLLEAETDVALGPARDGGYWGISARRIAPEMFAGVEWSTPRALRQTAEACLRADLTVGFGREWFDVDTPEDLRKWMGREEREG